MIPGANLLKTALSVITPQTIAYYRFLNRALNNVGQDVTSYDVPQFIQGSFQPVQKSLYQSLGLDFQKVYYVFYSLNDVLDLQRDVSGDQIIYNERRFQCESAVDWFSLDLWKGVLCCLVTNSNSIPNYPYFGFNTTPPSNDYLNFDNAAFSEGGNNAR